LAQRDAGAIDISSTERLQGVMWVHAACDAVAEVVRSARGKGNAKVLIGLGMPGLKTPNRRGIAVINNGPRIPDYLEQFETRLAELKIDLLAPVFGMGSDADFCGLGEEHAADGMFRDVDNAYYVGCGTGIADALKLHGKLVTFDDARDWIQKAWQIPSALGPTFEKLISAKAMNDCYDRMLGNDALGEERYPEIDAAAGHPIAITLLDMTALVLAELTFERIETIYNGRAEQAHRGAAYLALEENHPYRETWLDRVVVGQRLGMICRNNQYRSYFRDRLKAHLAARIHESGDTEMRRHYLVGNALKSGFVRASRLRAAPAMGAGIAAMQSRVSS
jgi:predicted NBD/HSP70 family sugar kinase